MLTYTIRGINSLFKDRYLKIPLTYVKFEMIENREKFVL